MVARIKPVTFNGIDVREVDVQVHIANGLPSFPIVACLYPTSKNIR